MSNLQNKQALKSYCQAYHKPNTQQAQSAVDSFFADSSQINVVHPFNEFTQKKDYTTGFLTPLQESFGLLTRNEYIALGGLFNEQDWVACTGYYSGNFIKPWLGIPPTGALAHLRFAEFHRMETGKSVESYVFLDIPALMMHAGVWPINDVVALHKGYTGYLPGPTTADGLIWHNSDQERSDSTLQLTEDMLLNLATEDESWRPYWHDHMNWYGPAAFGAFKGIEEFASFQTPFEQTFTEWISGIMPGSRTSHFIRAADGDYSCLGGWPSLNCLQDKTFLGQPSKGKRLYMRVCDFWRREDDLLADNWVFVDIPHVLAQMDFDVFAHLNSQVH